ncbi:MAG: hypothetical protein ACI4AK_02125 [Lepagella sp.]
MKKILTIFALLGSIYTCLAQNEVDNFEVGPYEVEYTGPGIVKYRIRDNINLYDYYELMRDTTIISKAMEIPVKHAIQISGKVGSNRYAPKEVGIEGVWKQNIGKNLYFNGGVSLTFGFANYGDKGIKRNMLEVGIPLQIELGKLNHQYASLYGLFGLMPTVYTTLSATKWDGEKRCADIKKTGFLVAPSLELGGNIPIGNVILRIGVYGIYKVNCTTTDFDIYKLSAGRMFAGAKIGIVL